MPGGSHRVFCLCLAAGCLPKVRHVQLAVHLPFKTLAWSPFGNGRLLPSVLLFTDSFIVLSFRAQGWGHSLLTQDTFSHGDTPF